MDTRASLLHAEAINLIKLVDEYLSRTGQNITSYCYNAATASASTAPSPYAPRNDVPASLHCYPVVPLKHHLNEQARELKELAALNAKIRDACSDNELYDFTRNLLAEEYQKVKGVPVNVEDFEQTSVAKMLALLRAEQKKAEEPELYPFALRAIERIDNEGKVRRLQTYWKPYDASWKDVQNSLTEMTLRQAQELGYPKGFSLRDGKWMYWVTHDGKPDKVKIFRDLESTEQYRAMRQEMDKDKTFGVLIWHEKMWEASRKAKAACLEQRQKDREEFGGSPQPHEKSPHDLDPKDLPELMGEWTFDVHSTVGGHVFDGEGEA